MPKEGETVECWDGSKMTMIDGKYYNIGTDGNGKTVCEQYNADGTPTNPVKKGVRTVNDAEGAAVAQGITDALQIKEVADEFNRSPEWFCRKMSYVFMEKNTTRTMTTDWSLQHFAYSAATGVAASMIISRLSKQNNTYEAALYKGLIAAGLDPEQVVLDEAFWAAWHNTTRALNGSYVLTVPFSSGGIYGQNLNKQIGLMDIIRVNTAMYAVNSVISKSMPIPDEDDAFEYVKEALLDLISFLPLGDIISNGNALKGFMKQFRNENPNASLAWYTSSGMTNDMIEECENDLLPLGRLYDMKTQFVSIGLQNNYMAMCLQGCLDGAVAKANGPIQPLMVGDLYKSVQMYMTNSAGGDASWGNKITNQIFIGLDIRYLNTFEDQHIVDKNGKITRTIPGWNTGRYGGSPVTRRKRRGF